MQFKELHTMAPKKTVEKKGGKKKLSGYMAYAKERRPSLKEEKPDLTFGEVRTPPMPPVSW